MCCFLISCQSNTNTSGLTSIKDVDKHIRTTTSKLINEINFAITTVPVMAEVRKVLTTVKDLPLDTDDTPQYELLGSIYFQQVNGKGRPYEMGESKGLRAKPLNPNIKELPVQGEYVMVQRLFGQYFYSSRINLFNNPNNASYQGFSKQFQLHDGNKKRSKTLETANTGISQNRQARKGRKLGESFESNFNFRQVVADEGDVVFNGRFGNSIKLGSNTKNEAKDSPNIKLRAGQLQDADKFGQDTILEQLNNSPLTAPVAENINLDASSMWMTTDETVSLTPATLEDNNIYPTEVAPAEFSGKQIILNSGRLIFNSKESGILGFSNGPIDFSTLNSFGVAAKQDLNLYSPTIKVGRDGENGKTKSISLLGQDIYLQNESGYTFVTSKGIELGSSNLEPAVKGDTLEEILSELMDVVSDLSSAVATIVTTPVTIGVLATPTPQPYAREASRAYQALSSLATLSIKLNTMKSRVVTLQ